MSLELITAICAIITSITAIILNILTLRMQRIHNFKTVKPIAYIDIFDYPDHTAIEIINSGLGPLTIKGVLFSDNLRNSDNISKLFPEVFGRLKFKNFNPEPVGTVMVPGEKLNVVDFRTDTEDAESIRAREELRAVLGGLTLTVDYCDVYDRMQPGRERNLSLFLRKTNWKM